MGLYFALMLAIRITLPPFLVSSAMNLPKSGGEPANTVDPRSATQVGNPRFQLGIGEARTDLLVELLDDLCGRVLGCADAHHSRAQNRPGWNVRQRIGPRRG